jgi:hypothetical protein
VSPFPGLPTDVRKDETATRNQERAIVIDVSRWVGAEIRPTRVFVWFGSREPGQEWLLPLDRKPRLLRRPRKRRHLSVGRQLELSYLGNPLVTLGLFGWAVGRRLTGRDR